MDFWLFTVTQRKHEGEIFTPDRVMEQRFTDKFWGLGERTPNRKSLRKGDQVVFYKGIPHMTIAASAVLASDCFALTDEQKSIYDHGKAYFRPDYGVLLENIHIWENPRLVKDLIPNLLFIENKENWGAYFQGGVRQLSEDDYRTITENLVTTSPYGIKTQEEIINSNQFALEAHLEEFIDNNWKNINFNAPIFKYELDEQNGRQFPAGPWSIDFLCIDKSNMDIVVIELKRGKTSDSTVGQVLRYMGWVSENIAKNGQKVRGIIIARDVDDALRYAVKGLGNVTVMTYQVNFKLEPFNK